MTSPLSFDAESTGHTTDIRFHFSCMQRTRRTECLKDVCELCPGIYPADLLNPFLLSNFISKKILWQVSLTLPMREYYFTVNGKNSIQKSFELVLFTAFIRSRSVNLWYDEQRCVVD
jgi:hypothetical protein